MLSADQIIYDALARAARLGAPCPTNGALAALIGASSSATAVRTLQRLKAQGAIRLHSGNCRRVVEIPALQMRTAGALPAPHWRERRGEAINMAAPPTSSRVRLVPQETPVEAGRPTADMRTCFRCGVRSHVHEAHGCQRWVEA